MSLPSGSRKRTFATTEIEELEDTDDFSLGESGRQSVEFGQSVGGPQQLITEFREKIAEMELREAKQMCTITQLKLENTTLQAELKQQKLTAEINELQAKMVKMEKEQQQKEKDERGKYAIADQLTVLQNVQKEFLERICGFEKQRQQQSKATADQLAKLQNDQQSLLESISDLKNQQHQQIGDMANELSGRIGQLEKYKQKKERRKEALFNFLRNRWDVFARHKHIEMIGDNRLTVRHKGNDREWCSVFTEFPILLDSDSSDIFYYEILVKNLKSCVQFGFAANWLRNSRGSIHSHGDTFVFLSNGSLWINAKRKGQNDRYSFGVGVVAGIGLILATRQIIFTRNGRRLEAIEFFVDPFAAVKELFPFVSLWDAGDKIEANFGPKLKVNLATL